MRQISAYPDVHLGHSETTRRTYNTRTVTTWYTPVRIPRPEEGVAAYKVPCLHCGKTVTWKISSAARTSWARRRWLLIALAGILAFIGGIVIISAYGNNENPNIGLVWLTVIMVFGGFVASLTGLLLWFQEQGVRVPEMYHRPRRPRRGISQGRS
jgi:hypothetical protein